MEKNRREETGKLNTHAQKNTKERNGRTSLRGSNRWRQQARNTKKRKKREKEEEDAEENQGERHSYKENWKMKKTADTEQDQSTFPSQFLYRPVKSIAVYTKVTPSITSPPRVATPDVSSGN